MGEILTMSNPTTPCGGWRDWPRSPPFGRPFASLRGAPYGVARLRRWVALPPFAAIMDAPQTGTDASRARSRFVQQIPHAESAAKWPPIQERGQPIPPTPAL